MAARATLMGHVPHLYIPPPWEAESLSLPDAQLHHLRKVLRLQSGAPVSYTDGRGLQGWGVLRGERVERGEERETPRPTDVSVAVAPPTSRHRARYLVEKLGELGVEALLWLRTRHGEGRPPSPAKVLAWSVSALEQSRGAWLMETESVDWDQLSDRVLVVADPAGESTVPSLVRPILVIGPEGGLSEDEIPASALRMCLGSTVLRVETAAVVGAALLAPGRRDGG